MTPIASQSIIAVAGGLLYSISGPGSLLELEPLGAAQCSKLRNVHPVALVCLLLLHTLGGSTLYDQPTLRCPDSATLD